jgi:serine/threonine protein kinase
MVLKAVRLFPAEAARMTAEGAIAEALALAMFTQADVGNVVKMEWVVLWGDWMLTALEFAEGGTLEKEVWKKSARDPMRGTRKWEEWVRRRETRCLHVARVLLRVIEELYGRGFIHRDLKPANILVCGDGNLRVADFNITAKNEDGVGPPVVGGGEAEEEEGGGTWDAWGGTGTLLVVAPEVLAGGVYDEKIDVYSAGKVLVHLFKGVKFLDYVYQSKMPALEVGERMEGWTKEGQIFLARMLAEDPEQRPTLAELERDWAPALEAHSEEEGQVRREIVLTGSETNMMEAATLGGVTPWRPQWEKRLMEMEAERVRNRPRRVALWELVEQEAERMMEEAEEEGTGGAGGTAFLEQRKRRLASGC